MHGDSARGRDALDAMRAVLAPHWPAVFGR
jgi:hypothetical protein